MEGGQPAPVSPTKSAEKHYVGNREIVPNRKTNTGWVYLDTGEAVEE
jgi:hypothetical protein